MITLPVVFDALSNDTRFHMVRRLLHGTPLSITQLTHTTGITRQATTQHLHALRDAGLVTSARRGREQVWSTNYKALREAQTQFVKFFPPKRRPYTTRISTSGVPS